METQHLTGQLLVFKEGTSAPVHRAQRGQIRCRHVELLAEMTPQDGGTMRTASNTRPLMRRKPICSASPNLSDGPRRPSIRARSLAVKVKNASISKPLNSRGNCLSPRNVACQWFIASLPDRDTIALKNHEQQHLVSATKSRHPLYDYRQILPSLLEAKMRGPRMRSIRPPRISVRAIPG